MFNVLVTDQYGTEETLKYDPKLNTLKDTQGEHIVEPKSSIQDSPVHQVSPDNPIGKSGNVKKLKVQLGLKCNFSCSYCLQSSHIPDANITNLKDAEVFLSRMDEWLTSVPERVEFWGGEPLVYFKKLKILVPALRRRFPRAVFLIITNGSLLNDEVVDFITKYDIQVGMSHDGNGQELRGDDPLEDPTVLAACKRLVTERPFAFSFQSVLTKKNKDIASLYSFFKAKLGVDAPVSFEGIVSYYDERTLDESRLSDEELLHIENEIFYELANERLDGTSFGERMFLALDSLQEPVSQRSVPSKCSMDKEDHLTVDLNGDIATCQNVGPSGDHYVGSVYDLKNTALKSSTHWAHRRNCSDCPMFRICGGSCMYQHGKMFDETCRADYAQAMGIFKALIYRLTGKVVTQIKRTAPSNSIPLTNL